MNHLIIGLGGTGGRVIRSFRKSIFQSFRSTEPAGVNIDYLYVDSDDRMMGLTDVTWKTFGQSVQLDPRNQLVIKSADLSKCLADLPSYGNLRPWLGGRDQWKDILSGIADATIGGQKRRLGRFLFARGIDEFERKLNDIVRGLRTKGDNDKAVTFHVVAGLAGGTGSGSVVDAITQIRRAYPFDSAHTHPVIVYALLPDRVPKPDWNTGNYWANGYAALMELNALGIDWQPVDLKSSQGARITRQRVFDGCYVFSNENDYVSVDVENDMPDIVASFLYQKTVMVQDSAFHQRLGRIEACENGDSSPEYDGDSKSGPPQRCRNFLTFGVKRLAYPEEEIQEYISYTFGLQAANQLQFNNWVENLGYADHGIPQASLADARKKELLDRWKLSDDHLTLSRGILAADAADKSWKLIHNEWHDLIPAFRQGAMDGVNQNWLLSAKSLFEGRFQTGFRRLGVAQFYSTRLSAKDQHSTEICSSIERQLFDEWATGDRSMHDTGRLLDAVLMDLDVRKKAIGVKASDLAAEIDDLNTQIAANETQWPNIGILGQLLNHRQRLLDAQCPLLATFFERQTLREAYGFALAVLRTLSQDVEELKAHLVRMEGRIAHVTGQYKTELSIRLQDSTLRDGASADGQLSSDQVVRFYDRAVVLKMTEGMKLDQSVQRTNAGEVRKTVIAQLGGTNTFARLDETLTAGTLRDLIDRTCTDFSKSTHDVSAKNEQQRILGVNIVNKLRERYESDDEGLRLFVQNIMTHANDYLVMDRNQQYPNDVKPVRETIVIMPAIDNNTFAQRLGTVFTNFAPGTVFLAKSESRKNEIVVISLLNLFPLRYSGLAGYLKDKYEERVTSGDAARARHEMHTEGDGTQFPNLFRLKSTEVPEKALPLYLLGHALGLIRQSPGIGGATEWTLLYKDDDGLPADPIYFGKAITEAHRRLEDTTILFTLQREVKANLSKPDRRSDEAKRVLHAALGEVVSQIQTERQNDLNDGLFRTYRDAAKTAIRMLGQGV